MAESGDVTVYYRLVPTEDSIRKSSEQIVNNINSGFKKGFSTVSKDASKKLESVFSIIPGVKGLGQVMAPISEDLSEIMKTTMAGFKGARAAGAGIGEAAGAGAAAGREAAGAMGGIGPMLAEMRGGIAAMVGMLAIISVAMLIVSAFFEAVGPLIKVMVKILSAMILLMLIPVLRIILPYLPGIVRALISLSKWLGEIFGVLAGVMIDWLKSMWNSLVIIADKITSAFGKLAKGDIIGFFTDIFGAGIEAILLIIKGAIGPFLWGIADAIVKNAPAIIEFLMTTLTGIWDIIKLSINWIGEFVFGKETWTQIKNAVKFIQSIFTVEGLWTQIKAAIDFIGESVFGKGLWEQIKQAIKDVNDMINDEWANIIQTLKDIGAALKPILDFLHPPRKEPESREMAVMLGETPVVTGTYAPGGTKYGPRIDDFISRPGMGIQSFSPSDTIIGTKGGMGGGVTVNNTFNIDAGVDSSRLKEILSKFAREQARELRMRTSYSGGVYA